VEDNAEQEVTDREFALGEKEWDWEAERGDFPKRKDEELWSPGRQSYRSGWMAGEWECRGRDERQFHRTVGYMAHRGIRGIKMRARKC